MVESITQTLHFVIMGIKFVENCELGADAKLLLILAPLSEYLQNFAHYHMWHSKYSKTFYWYPRTRQYTWPGHPHTPPSRETRWPMNSREGSIPIMGRGLQGIGWLQSWHRCTLPPPHWMYPPADQQSAMHIWRLLRTNIFSNPDHLTRIHPTVICCLCGEHATFSHIIWACPQNLVSLIASKEHWEATLHSSNLDL